VPIPDYPHPSLIFGVAKFVSTLIFLSSLTLLTILILLMKALLISLCDDTRLGLHGVTGVALVAIVGVAYKVGVKDGWQGLVGGMDM
jgi:hypothetical protein